MLTLIAHCEVISNLSNITDLCSCRWRCDTSQRSSIIETNYVSALRGVVSVSFHPWTTSWMHSVMAQCRVTWHSVSIALPTTTWTASYRPTPTHLPHPQTPEGGETSPEKTELI